MACKRVKTTVLLLTDLPDDVLYQIAKLVPQELHVVCKPLQAAVYAVKKGLQLSVWRLQHPQDRQRLVRFRGLVWLKLSPWGEMVEGVEPWNSYGTPLAWLKELPQLGVLNCEEAPQDVIPLVAELTFLRGLSLNNSRKIADISQLTSLTRLTHLMLSCTAVVDPSPLATLPNLQHLNLSDDTFDTRHIDLKLLEGLTAISCLILSNSCQQLGGAKPWLSSLAPLSGLTTLTHLDVSVGWGRVGPADIAPLAALTRLRFLQLRNSRVYDVKPLAGMVRMQRLTLRGSQVQDVRPLSGMKKLHYLNLRWTRVEDVKPLAGMVKLRGLWLSWNQVQDVSPLTALKALTMLHMAGCSKVKDLSHLGIITTLQDLDLRGCPFTDVSPLTCLASLTRLCFSQEGASEIAKLDGMQSLKLELRSL